MLTLLFEPVQDKVIEGQVVLAWACLADIEP